MFPGQPITAALGRASHLHAAAAAAQDMDGVAVAHTALRKCGALLHAPATMVQAHVNAIRDVWL